MGRYKDQDEIEHKAGFEVEIEDIFKYELYYLNNQVLQLWLDLGIGKKDCRDSISGWEQVKMDFGQDVGYTVGQEKVAIRIMILRILRTINLGSVRIDNIQLD